MRTPVRELLRPSRCVIKDASDAGDGISQRWVGPVVVMDETETIRKQEISQRILRFSSMPARQCFAVEREVDIGARLVDSLCARTG